MKTNFFVMTFVITIFLFVLNPTSSTKAQENMNGTINVNDTNLENKTAVVLGSTGNETVIIIGESNDTLSSANTPEKVGSLVTSLLNKTGIIISNLPETVENATEKGGLIISNASVPAGQILENITGKIIGIFK